MVFILQLTLSCWLDTCMTVPMDGPDHQWFAINKRWWNFKSELPSSKTYELWLNCDMLKDRLADWILKLHQLCCLQETHLTNRQTESKRMENNIPHKWKLKASRSTYIHMWQWRLQDKEKQQIGKDNNPLRRYNNYKYIYIDYQCAQFHKASTTWHRRTHRFQYKNKWLPISLLQIDQPD